LEKAEERKKEKPKKKTFHVRRLQRIQGLAQPAVQKGHISEVELSNSSNEEETVEAENNLSYEE